VVRLSSVAGGCRHADGEAWGVSSLVARNGERGGRHWSLWRVFAAVS